MKGRVDVPVLVLRNILMHLIEGIIDIYIVSFFFYLNNRQTIYQECGVEDAVLFAGQDSLTLNLIDHLVASIAGPNLILIEDCQESMLAII